MTFVNNLKGYRIIYAVQAKKVIDKYPKNIAQKIYEKLDELVAGEQKLDVKKLKNHQDQRYRLRVGDYRVVFDLEDDEIIMIVDVDHRKNIYRR